MRKVGLQSFFTTETSDKIPTSTSPGRISAWNIIIYHLGENKSFALKLHFFRNFQPIVQLQKKAKLYTYSRVNDNGRTLK